MNGKKPLSLAAILFVCAGAYLLPQSLHTITTNFDINKYITPIDSMFTQHIYFARDRGDSLPYRLSVPHDRPSLIKKKYPLIIFLHGSGERGCDNVKQLKFFDILYKHYETYRSYPAYILIPQCPNEKRWVEVDWNADSHVMPDTISPSLKKVIAIIDELIRTKDIDTSRIYLIGLSMGGFGVWDLISRFPNRFAAAVPICGGGDEHQADKLIHIPIWAFHGAKDEAVRTMRTRNMISAIKAAGGDPRYTEYPDVAHGSWYNAFKEPELLKWLFDQQLPAITK